MTAMTAAWRLGRRIKLMAVAGAAKCFFGSHVIRTRALYTHNTAAEATRARPPLLSSLTARVLAAAAVSPRAENPTSPSIDRGIRTHTELVAARTHRARKHRLVFHRVVVENRRAARFRRTSLLFRSRPSSLPACG